MVPDHRQEKVYRKRWNRRGFRNKRPVNYPICPACGRFVKDLNSAISYSQTKTPSHFDCVLKDISDANEVMGNEKICYLGGGSFGIVQLRGSNSPLLLFIRKRIQYEDKDNPPDWRKSVCRNVIPE